MAGTLLEECVADKEVIDFGEVENPDTVSITRSTTTACMALIPIYQLPERQKGRTLQKFKY